MPQVHVIVASAEEADEGIAEFWCAGEMVAETVIHEGQLHLRIDPRIDREPWLIEVSSLALVMEGADSDSAVDDAAEAAVEAGIEPLAEPDFDEDGFPAASDDDES